MFEGSEKKKDTMNLVSVVSSLVTLRPRVLSLCV